MLEKFAIVTTKTGALSIRNNVVGEIMHNPVGPWAEAQGLYIEQSGLQSKLVEKNAAELVLFDVGLGAATNAVAALHCARNAGPGARPLRIVSFESDLDLLGFTIRHASHFPHLQGYEKVLETIGRERRWNDEKVSWELREGNFLETIEGEVHRPHQIFFDPYSPKVNTEMWTVGCFQKLRKKSRSIEDGGTSLYTYSQATKIRVALIRAGFFVGYGRSTGLKTETTQAATDLSLLAEPLGAEWHDRWKRSHDRYPFDCESDQERAEADASVEEYFHA